MRISGMSLSNFSYKSNTGLSRNFSNNTEKSKQKDAEGKNNSVKNNLSMALGGKTKKNSILENLMKQKEKLAESKTNIIEKSLEKGNDPLSVQEKLEAIDKQIQEIDKQINDLKMAEQRKALGIEDKDKKSKDSKQKENSELNKDEQKDSYTNNILDMSSNLSKAKALSSQRNKMEGTSNVLENEIKTDEKRGINPVRKKKELSNMKDKIKEIGEKLDEHLKDVNTESSKNTESKNASTNENSENRDQLLIKQQQAKVNIKHYIDNQKDKAEDNIEKINIIA